MTNIKIINPYQKEQKVDLISRLLGRSLTTRLHKGFIAYAMRFYHRRDELFEGLEIETINRCNNTCSFCPVNAKEDPRPLDKMTEATFHKIADELGCLDYAGRIAMHSNNEPYLDKQLIPRIGYLRKRCPRAFLYVYTNGLPLNFEKVMRSIDAGLDSIVIDNYNDDLTLNPAVEKMVNDMDSNGKPFYAEKIVIHLRKKNEILGSRGGSAPNKLAEDFKDYLRFSDAGCTTPFWQLVVRPSGKVSLCCNDALGQVTLGDVNVRSLQEIWRSSEYRHVRDELLRNGRQNLPLCKVCDVAYISNDVRHILKRWPVYIPWAHRK